MKVYTILLLPLLFLLSGCWRAPKKVQTPQARNNDEVAMPLAQGKKNSPSMLSFFDEDVRPFEEIETFVLEEESPPAKDETITIAQAGQEEPIFDSQEEERIDREKKVVYFDYDSNQLCEGQKEAVYALKKQIKQWIKKGYKVVFRGHACKFSPKGDSLYNMFRSNDRAITLANALQVPESKRTVVGLGYEEPDILEEVPTKKGQARNRRVEVYPITV